MKGLILGSLAVLSLSAAAHSKKLCEGIFPKNNVKIGPEVTGQGIDEATFNDALDKVVAVYNSIAQASGYQLQFNRLWSDDTVNSDTETEGDTWIVNSYGGLARYMGMTEDAFIAVACHELGHHLGGAPLFDDGSGMSVEGEADYHVGTKCLRKIFANDDNVGIIGKATIDPLVLSRCEASFVGDNNAIALCERSAAAGLVLGVIMSELDGTGPVAFNTPDPSVVTVTYEDHPAAQCRLDTYFNSGVCTISSDVPFSPTDPAAGGCMTGTGIRPACWFYPGN
jgi:hypothetical protein